MKSKLTRLNLAIKELIWKIRIRFQTFKEKTSEIIFRKNIRDAKRIGKEMAVKDRTNITNMELDIRNDDKLIYDIRYAIQDQIHERLPESKWLQYLIRKEREITKVNIKEAKHKQAVHVKILKSDIAKLKSENKKESLLIQAELGNEIRRKTDQYNLALRQLDEKINNADLSEDERLKLSEEKASLMSNHNLEINDLKARKKNAKGADIEEIMIKIEEAKAELISSKDETNAYIKEQKESLKAFVDEKQQRLSEIKQNPDSEKGPINPNKEPDRPLPQLSKAYERENEKEAILMYTNNIKKLQVEFRNVNREIRLKESELDQIAKEEKSLFVESYINDKLKGLHEELSLKEASLEMANKDEEIIIRKDIKDLRKQIKRRSYVENIEAEHQYQLKVAKDKEQLTKELKDKQKEVHDQMVLNNRKIREVKDNIYFKEKAHKVAYYTEYYKSKSDKEVLKMVPPTRRQSERRARTGEASKNWLQAALYLIPALVLLGIFTFYPIINSFIVSFYKGYNIQTGEIDGYTLIGNYQTVLQHANFSKAVLNTGVIVFISVPLTIIVGLLIAVALHAIKPLKGFFQTVFFLPYVTNTIAIGLVFAYIFSGNRTTINAGQISGLANQIIRFFGGTPQPWLSVGATYWTAMAVIIVYSLWNGLAFKIIVFLAGIQGIDKQYYQASQIDGATKMKQFRRITVPLLSPMILYILITSVIGAFKTYTSVVAIIGPTGVITAGASGSVYLKTIVFYIYDYINMAGLDGMMSLASAAAIILFVIILFFTGIQMLASKSRVHY